jgi:mono/diheme cytochrome c family protein
MKYFLVSILLLMPAIALADDSSDSMQRVAHWTFDELPKGDVKGKVTIAESDLVSPLFPGFAKRNSALSIKSKSYLKLSGSTDGKFDFDNGDSITAEAWVNLKSLSQQAYIISKGRTGTTGAQSKDQNWAFRVRNMKGQGCVNFLFHSKSDESQPGDWHRWTSDSGIGIGDGWHHVAVSYKFGEPDSIRGFVDGKQVKGKWDMGGPTTRPPASTTSPVWIGSAMAGNAGNSFDGQMDELAVYRSIVPADDLKSRYQCKPTLIVRPPKSGVKVVNELYGPISSTSSIPTRTAAPKTTWDQDTLAFTRLPNNFDSWGVRDDWTEGGGSRAMFVRSWMDLELEPGDYRFLVRSRGYSRLFVDGQKIVSTPKQENRSGAHHVVDPLPEVPVMGMRPAFMSDHERIVDFHSDGGPHELRFEVIVGGPSYRLEFGETSVAIARPDEMFQLVSSSEDYALDDRGWQRFTRDQNRAMANLDSANRRSQSALQDEYWNRRHAYAKQHLKSNDPVESIDAIIGQRINAENEVRANVKSIDSDDTFFHDHVQPILQSNCGRCHGEKQKGELSVLDRENLLRGGESGDAAIVPGKPNKSYLLELVSADADDHRMPPKGDGLSNSEIQTLRKWIVDGAAMPALAKPAIHQTAEIDEFTFLRRVYIDTVGVPPTSDEANVFLKDHSADRREKLVDRLLSDPRWADNWVGYWQDALAENPNLLKPTLNNTGPFRYWIYEALVDNKPIDRFATELIQMRGSKWSGGAGGFSIASQNDSPMAAKAHVIGTAFMGVELKCARCHDAPYHSWKQSDLFQLAAMLQRESIKLPKTSTVPAAFFEKQERESLIKVTLKPGETVHGDWPFASFAPNVQSELLQSPGDSRELLAAQVSASRRFAEVIANRLWKRLIGSGIVEPVDDWQGNPPSDPRLLARLADALIESDYDLKSLAKLILVSDVYQRKAVDAGADSQFFAGPQRRRMTAEQIVDSAFSVVGMTMQTEQLTLDIEGTLPADQFLNFGFPKRSWEFSTLANERDRPSLALPKVQAITDVLTAFGWRNSRPEPTSAREEDPNLVQPGALANGTLGVWLTRLSNESAMTDLMCKEQPVESLVEELFLRMLTRLPTAAEQMRFVALLSDGYENRLSKSVLASLTPDSKRFRYVSWSNHLNTDANVIKVEMQELVRQGPEPTYRLKAQWREKAEDAIWALLNSPESILVP